MSQLYILKYGGKTIASPELIKKRAQYISQLYKEGHKVIVVVSAMGDTTDQLYKLASSISKKPTTRELDVLLTSGERISMSLMTMALQETGCPAISFTGSQAGILTSGSHSTSSIKEIKPIRVEEELEKNKIVVIAGFQGVDPTSKDITTLGRGGSDTTALALANYFKTDHCYILKDVDGVYNKDPSQFNDAKKVDSISTKQLKDITLWGAKLCHYKAAELAHDSQQNYWIASASDPSKKTHVHNNETSAAIITRWDNVLEYSKNLSINEFLKNYDVTELPSTNSFSYWAGGKPLITTLAEDIKKRFEQAPAIGFTQSYHFSNAPQASEGQKIIFKNEATVSLFSPR